MSRIQSKAVSLHVTLMLLTGVAVLAFACHLSVPGLNPYGDYNPSSTFVASVRPISISYLKDQY